MHSIAPPPPEKVVSFLDGPLNTDFQYVWHFFGKAASLSDKSQAKMLTLFTQLMGLLFIDGVSMNVTPPISLVTLPTQRH